MTYADPGFDPDVIHVCARCDAEYPSEITAYRCCNATRRQEDPVTIEELALKIAKEQGSDALDDRLGLGEMLGEYALDTSRREELAELVRAIHGKAWHMYAEAVS